jgi:hypothetical protein
MLLKTKHCPTSQAGRRGFESRLPLHFFSSLASITFFTFTLFTSKSLITTGDGTTGAIFSHRRTSQGTLQSCDRFPPAHQICLGVRVDCNPDCVPSLISCVRFRQPCVTPSGRSW